MHVVDHRDIGLTERMAGDDHDVDVGVTRLVVAERDRANEVKTGDDVGQRLVEQAEQAVDPFGDVGRDRWSVHHPTVTDSVLVDPRGGADHRARSPNVQLDDTESAGSVPSCDFC